jgi:ferric-dicitrate binding protein FerR (iron transport regulator)
MTRFLRVCLWVLLSALFTAPSVFAQSAPAPDTAPPPAHVSLVEGQVFLEREGRSESALENVPLLDGDRLRTERGRAEIMLGDGSLLHLDETTTVDMLAGDLIRLLGGRINLVVLGARDPSRAVAYQVDAPAARVTVLVNIA